MGTNTVPSSIIQFSVANFGCFRDRVDFSMVGRQGSKNIFPLLQTGDQLFKTAIIYGPNASGKSTLIDALNFMITKIRKSTDPNHIEGMKFEPFLMEDGYDQKPSFFEIVFLINRKVYRYNFSLFNDHSIEEERLYAVRKTSDYRLFHRKEKHFDVKDSFSKDKAIPNRTNKTALFLSVASQWNVTKANDIVRFFKSAINAMQGFETSKYGGFTISQSRADEKYKTKALDYLQKADFCISDFKIIEKPLPEEIKKVMSVFGTEKEFGLLPKKMHTVQFIHDKYDSSRKVIGKVKIPILKESRGTQTFFEELGLIIDTLESGTVLFIDELNSSLHPLLCQFIIELFHSKKTNQHNAQLIVTTHDITLLSDKSIDRDQFWFTERDCYGCAKLFSLAEFKDRKDSSDFQARYLRGRYGALPYIDDSFLKD